MNVMWRVSEVVERTGTMAARCNNIAAHCENVAGFRVVQGSRWTNLPPKKKKNGFDEMQTSTLTQNLASLPPPRQDPLQLMKGHSVGCPASL